MVQHILCHLEATRLDQIQHKAEKQSESSIATPARSIDFLNSEYIVVIGVLHMVLSETDQFLDLSVEPQIRKVWDNIKLCGQTPMFIVTWPVFGLAVFS